MPMAFAVRKNCYCNKCDYNNRKKLVSLFVKDLFKARKEENYKGCRQAMKQANAGGAYPKSI